MFRTYFSADKKIAFMQDNFEQPNDLEEECYYLPFIKLVVPEKDIFIIDIETDSSKSPRLLKSGTYYFADIPQVTILLNNSAIKNIKISLISSSDDNHHEISEVKEINISKDLTTKNMVYIFTCENKKQHVEILDDVKYKSDSYLTTVYKAKKWEN